MDYYNEIKNELVENEITKRAKDYSKNKSDLTHYYNVGKLLVDAQGGETRAKYGDGLIKEYSKRLTTDLGKGYSIKNLKRMRKFYLVFSKGSAVPTLLTWSHYLELLVLDNYNEIEYYINICIQYNLSYRELHARIKSNEYKRLDIKTRDKLIDKQDISITDLVKNPIIIRNNLNVTEISEKFLKKLILEDLDNFLKELGTGFLYVGNDHKIKIGDKFNYIDLLLFNIKFNCYVVIELKITELKKEHIGQIEVYMNYIDKNVKEIQHDKTIGIIICKKDNKLIMEYSSDKRIISREFKLIY